jgi:hypothetical protein
VENMKVSKYALGNGLFLALAFAGVLQFGQIASRANPVTLAPNGSASASSESFSAANLLATTSVNFSSGTLSGILVSSVYSGDSGSEYGLAALTFVYEIELSSGSPDAASAIAIGNFSSFNTDVGYDASNGGTAPTTFSRDPNGSQIAFNFGSYILKGDDSAYLIVQTDATTYSAGIASVTDEYGTGPIDTYAPAPDATGIGSFIFALALLFGFERLRKTNVLSF